MAGVTYYAVLPFVRDKDGNLCPDEAVWTRKSRRMRSGRVRGSI